MSPLYTRPQRDQEPQLNGGKLAPGLLYHKWHVYDDDKLKHTESRPGFLRKVAEAVEATRKAGYADWLRRYEAALRGVAGEELTCFSAKTVWRLAMGLATNPALELGLTLHPLLGFPYLPGSGVKGLAHTTAETELISKQEEWVEGNDPPVLPDASTLNDLLARAKLVKAAFGSLHLLPPKAGSRPRTACSLLEGWLAQDDFPKDLRLQTRELLEATGGLVTFYDAVPDEMEENLLQLDVMTPHYPDYYRAEGKTTPPSDDQDPNPLLFLAVRPGATFRFAFRASEHLATMVKAWLTGGLQLLGAGAKTATGYGYFE
jgi:CRISPR-associated protein Cmr6